jgi:GNAT superfamily N-acetyltransferase
MASWREMTVGDIPGILRVADEVHPDLPESSEMFTERVNLFPQGCLILTNADGEVCGYIISHPIPYHQPPALDSLLGEINPEANQYYIHDLAILPKLRGQRCAAGGVKKLLKIAEERFPSTCLISVYSTSAFWARFGFIIEPIDDDAVLKEKLRDYGDGATYMSLSHQQKS